MLNAATQNSKHHIMEAVEGGRRVFTLISINSCLYIYSFMGLVTKIGMHIRRSSPSSCCTAVLSVSNNLTLALTAAEERASAAAACNDASSCTLDDVAVVELSPSPPEVLLTADGSVLTGASPLSLY